VISNRASAPSQRSPDACPDCVCRRSPWSAHTWRHAGRSPGRVRIARRQPQAWPPPPLRQHHYDEFSPYCSHPSHLHDGRPHRRAEPTVTTWWTAMAGPVGRTGRDQGPWESKEGGMSRGPYLGSAYYPALTTCRPTSTGWSSTGNRCRRCPTRTRVATTSASRGARGRPLVRARPHLQRRLQGVRRRRRRHAGREEHRAVARRTGQKTPPPRDPGFDPQLHHSYDQYYTEPTQGQDQDPADARSKG
jgi:hypothetical protein